MRNRDDEREIEPRGAELVERYTKNYRLSAGCAITEAMVMRHWELEQSLRTMLLESTPANRWDVFQDCYGRLYGELDWLNSCQPTDTAPSNRDTFRRWAELIGRPPRKVYEVGSGKGELIQYLAAIGHECRGSEITDQRGQKWSTSEGNLSWGITDGIHLAQFERERSYDVVISDQVIEHLHPSDVKEHFIGARAILAPGGAYIFSTPHALWGPSDISKVFRRRRAMGMHLKEYTYGEIMDVLEQAGFTRIMSVFRLPNKIDGLLPRRIGARESRIYARYLRALEGLLARLVSSRRPRWGARLARVAVFPTDIMIVAKKT